MDQQMFWDSVFTNSVETQNLPGSPVFTTDANMPYIDLTDEDPDLNIWSSSGPSSSRHSLIEAAPEEIKIENHWASPLTIDEGQGSRRVERHLENVNLDLNSNQVNANPSISENPSFPQTLDQNAIQALEPQTFSVPFVSGSSGSAHVPSSSGRRLSCKRKGIEGSGSSSRFYQGESSSMHSVSARQNASTTLTISSSSNYSSGANPNNVIGSGESSQRNCRIRINPTQNAAAPHNQWAPVNNLHSSALPAPPLVQNMHPFPVNVASSSRTSAVQSSFSRDDSNSRSLPRNNFYDHSHLMQHSSTWSLAPALQAPTSSRVVQSLTPTWTPHQNPSQYQRALPEVGQALSISVPLPQSSGPGNNLQELRSQRAVAVLRGLQQSYVRSANGVSVDPAAVRSLTATRESRSRVLSEIRNALARRGEHIQLEDVLLYNHAIIYGRAADLHDRHRDMRLDVDNMSYEELLALEERIGSVNTGLGEEKILKSLKQRKYISLTEQRPGEVEPCCICQEEYVEEENVGRLDCRHDFHTACIKQWLMLKNLCPICKTTGLKA